MNVCMAVPLLINMKQPLQFITPNSRTHSIFIIFFFLFIFCCHVHTHIFVRKQKKIIYNTKIKVYFFIFNCKLVVFFCFVVFVILIRCFCHFDSGFFFNIYVFPVEQKKKSL